MQNFFRSSRGFARMVLLFSLFGLVACEKAGPKPSLDAKDFEGIDESGEVRLVSAGRGEARELRYDMAPGDKLRNDMEQRTESTVSVNGADMEVNMGMRFGMDMSVDSVAEDGSATLRFEVVDFDMIEDATSPMAMAGAGQLGSIMKGMRGTQSQDGRGRLLKMEIDTSNFPPQMAQIMSSLQDSFSQMNPLLPNEAVGKGASWKVFQVIDAAGMKIKQRMDVTLVDLDAQTATMEMEILQQGDMQLAEAMGMPPGTTLEVQEMKGSGKARLVLDRSLFVPRELDMTIKTKGKMKLEMGSTSQKMKLNTTSSVKIRASK